MVHKSAAVILGAIALNAASTIATPIAASESTDIPDGMVLARDFRGQLFQRNFEELEARRFKWSNLSPFISFVPNFLPHPQTQQQALPPPAPPAPSASDVTQKRQEEDDAESEGENIEERANVRPFGPIIPPTLPKIRPGPGLKPTGPSMPPLSAAPRPPPQSSAAAAPKPSASTMAPPPPRIPVVAPPVRSASAVLPPPPRASGMSAPLSGAARREVMDDEDLMRTHIKLATISVKKPHQQKPSTLHHRAIEELLGRELNSIEARRFISLLPKLPHALPFPRRPLHPQAATLENLSQQQASPQRRELEELLGRELTNVEARGLSQTFNKWAPWAPLIATGLDFLRPQQQQQQAPPPPPPPQRREPEELFERELMDVYFGA
ncbi:hypothetical protein HGRIS_011739 [Hohenbuehelia grisea]|uniref:Uncharacterized protein n=1 Tax=Hohenbuehelia grisea TaxID=104357 RepID=A0ABR3JW13_9AGAR